MMLNGKFVERVAEQEGPHALLYKIIAKLDGMEAHILLHGIANGAGSNVPQAILRDGLNRVRLQAEAKVQP
jgi:hypothetical protein